MKTIILVVTILIISTTAQARGTNGKRCIDNVQCGLGKCIPNFVGPYGICAGDT